MEPRLVAHVEFREWTKSGTLRAPSFKGLRPDVIAAGMRARGRSRGTPTGKFEPMPRAIWSGAISFGLVNIPVKLYSAVSRKTVRFHQLDAESGAAHPQQRVNPAHR